MFDPRRMIPAFLLTASLAMPATAAEQDGPQTLVTIEDFPLTNLHFALFASQTGRNPADAAGQISLLNELVNHFMIANSPEGRQLASEPDVVAALEVARARLVAQAFIRQQLDSTPISDDELKAQYDAQHSGPATMEYKARHILLETEEDAKSVIEALAGGEDFAELAGSRSTGPSKTVGGDLGWFEADQMVTAFATATAALADGSYSTEPVKTEFGWHVILREDSRETPRPSFESVREDLVRQVQRARISGIVNGIREKTRIEVIGDE